MRLHENKNIVFNEEIEASSNTAMMNLSSLSTINFGFFEHVELNILFFHELYYVLKSNFVYNLYTSSCYLKPNSSKNCGNKG